MICREGNGPGGLSWAESGSACFYMIVLNGQSWYGPFSSLSAALPEFGP